jgi:hypothetical protein
VRANQSRACDNRPPFEAFPTLPTLPHPPERVDPDAWLAHYHQRVFKRKASQNGMISVSNHDYYIGYPFRGKRVAVFLDAAHCVFKLLHRGSAVCEREIQGVMGYDMPFGDYLKHMLEEARTQTI